MPEPAETPEFDPPIGPDDAALPDEPPDLDELDPFEVDSAEYDDISEFVTEDWIESTTARQRVKDIINRTATPMSAPAVAEVAEVSPPTARTELSNLADEGVVLAESSTNGTIYQRDPDWYRLQRIQRLAGKPQAVVESVLRQIDQEIQGYKDTYDVESPEELILNMEDLGDGIWQDISEWRTALVDKEYLRTALQFRQLRSVEISDFDLSPSNSDHGPRTEADQ